MQGPWEFESPACAGLDTDLFYPERSDGRGNPHDQPILKRICGGCPHLRECGDWALRYENYGYWAGMTEMERRRRRVALGIVGWELSA